MLATTGVSLAVVNAVWTEIKSAGRASDEHLSIRCSARTCCAPARSSRSAASDASPARPADASSSWSAVHPSFAPAHARTGGQTLDRGVCVLRAMGESKRKDEYLCFPEHLCTCYSFYDIVGRGQQLFLVLMLSPEDSNAMHSFQQKRNGFF
ncbi:uncharacterized protein LOC133893660 [Phragmites australis]|uniref:uncharacterized protein LOC133893660 n=1 Tax=Phragmites australis TaxID=29695 RepID=UPI002D775EA3|nr:uncharacterized protein LOC133893660 [Phragmites australis]